MNNNLIKYSVLDHLDICGIEYEQIFGEGDNEIIYFDCPQCGGEVTVALNSTDTGNTYYCDGCKSSGQAQDMLKVRDGRYYIEVDKIASWWHEAAS